MIWTHYSTVWTHYCKEEKSHLSGRPGQIEPVRRLPSHGGFTAQLKARVPSGHGWNLWRQHLQRRSRPRSCLQECPSRRQSSCFCCTACRAIPASQPSSEHSKPTGTPGTCGILAGFDARGRVPVCKNDATSSGTTFWRSSQRSRPLPLKIGAMRPQ